MTKTGKTIKLRTGDIGVIGSLNGPYYEISVEGKTPQLVEAKLIVRNKRRNPKKGESNPDRSPSADTPVKRWDYKEIGGV